MSGTKGMLSWIDNVIKLDADKDEDLEHGSNDEHKKPEITENDTVSTNEILETVQSVLGFLGSVFDFLTETKKND